METHAQIVARLGLRTVARALGHANHTTVQGWHDRDKIPSEHWPDLIQAAEREGWQLSLRDLLPSELKDQAA